ncbi:MAG TPA: glutamyl-tRNA reductase [Candidatus Saccharimonadia bacterium]|nr:glutamyl-tRNA reductase [Candidatus Saccharimonadia bacterium]
MSLLALGLNHQTAPVALRERVAYGRPEALLALGALRALAGVREAAIVSTCNRTELYCEVDDGGESQLRRWLAQDRGLAPHQLDEFLYRHEDADAVRHLYRVATGLDSMVLGEPQILGQVKEAYHIAREAGTVHSALERLFQTAFAVAKRVRTDTRIGANPVSVAFAAVRLAQQVFADLEKCTVMMIGAGDTIELVAQHLARSGVGRMLVANRTLANAEALAERHDAQPLALADLGRHLHEADVVIASTASREPVVSRDAVAAALRERRRKPMLLLDLAVPRDIEPSTASLDDVYLYTIDDLGAVIEENLRSRRQAAREADAIIDLQVEHFLGGWRALADNGVLRRLRATGESAREQALAKAHEQLAAGRPAEEVLAQLAHALTNKLLHAPSANLRAAALRGDDDVVRAAERLFAPRSSEPEADA